MTKATTMAELAMNCKSWSVSVTVEVADEQFAAIVSSYLALTGSDQRLLADEFETAISTVSRWANGVARPRIRTQREVVEWIGKRAAKSVTRASASSPGYSISAPAVPMAARSK